MTIAFRIDHDRKIVVARGYGVFTDADIFGYQREAWSRDDVAGYDELIDMTHVSGVALPTTRRVQVLASVAADMDRSPARTRFAIVAPDDLTYGLGRMFQAYREAERGSLKEVGVFRTLAEALLFLKISEPPEFPPLPLESRPATQ